MKRFIRKCFKKGYNLISGSGIHSFDMYCNFVSIHPTTIIDSSAYIKIFNLPSPQEKCLEIGENSHIFSKFSILRPNAKIRIGMRCQIGNSHFISAERIDVGDDVIMAWGITIMDTDSHSLIWDYRRHDAAQCLSDYQQNPDNFIRTKDWAHVPSAPIQIGDKCWIGFEAAILKGVKLGEGAVVGARSVVMDDVPPYTLVAGNPAKIIRHIMEIS